MQWLEGIWKSLSDVFTTKSEQEITWHAMDTPDWIRPQVDLNFEDKFKTGEAKNGIKTLMKEGTSPFIFLGMLFLILYFLRQS